MVDVINKALDAETAPKLCQVAPSVEYCHVPLPVVAVIAKPLTAPVSTSAQVELVRIALERVPEEVVSSVLEVRTTDAPFVIVGASLTEPIVMDAVAMLVEKAVVVPLVEVSALPAVALVDAVPVVWSQAR